MNEDPEVTNRLKVIAKNFAPLAYINKRNEELTLCPYSSDDDEQYDEYGQKIKDSKAKKITSGQDGQDKVGESIMMEDPNQLDLINHLNSMKLLAISEAFDRFPKGCVDVDHFVNIMKDILSDTQLMDRPEFVSELVDLFYRASATKTSIMFEDLTSYLIEHEIESSKPLEKSNFDYYESKIVDQTTHNNYIGKIYYIDQLDKMLLYEHNNKAMRIYDGKTMRLKNDVVCSDTILAIEFISKKKLIAVLLSNKKINFHDTTTANYKIFRELYVPCTQRCL